MDTKTISILPEDLEGSSAYRLLASVVVPRPIAWVSTVGTDGTPNLAPFSFFNAVSGSPPIVMFSISQRRNTPKDTLRNVEESKEFVVNIVGLELAEAMNQTSGEWGYEVDEFEVAGLAATASVDVQPPRVAAAPVAMEAKLTQIIRLEETTSIVVFGRVVRFHVREGILRPNGLVDPELLQPVSRLGGPEYAKLGPVFSLDRPQV